MRSRKRTWFLIRIAAYIAVIAVLFLTRGNDVWRRLVGTLRTSGRPTGTLTIAGCDLAPRLMDRLLAAYLREYPDLTITRLGGGTNQALEDLLDGRADVALLYRLPSAREQDYFRVADGDSAIVVPVAVGGALLVRQRSTSAPALTPADLVELLTGHRDGAFTRLYTTDPNEGLWDAVRSKLAIEDSESAAETPVVFLADAEAVQAAVGAEQGAWGLVSSFSAPGDPLAGPPAGFVYVTMRATTDSTPASPTYENLATGAYPLHHVLYAAGRSGGDIEGAKFITYLTSAPGQRQVERAGFVPARRFAREIYLSRDPVGR